VHYYIPIAFGILQKKAIDQLLLDRVECPPSRKWELLVIGSSFAAAF